jgi:hypothetical protein
VPLGKVFLLQTDKVAGFLNPDDAVVYLPISSGQQLNEVHKLDAKG